MNLYFGVTIAPYAVDFCNALHERFHCRIFHRKVDVAGLAFNPLEVERDCRFPFERFDSGPGWAAFRRLWQLVREERPEVVFTSEFSLTTLRLWAIRRLSRVPFRLVSICDDSLDMIKGNDFSRRHRLARHFVPRLTDELILANPAARKWYQDHFGKGLLMPIISDEKRLRRAFEAALPRSSELTSQFNPERKALVLFVGRLIPLKNLDFLLEAAVGLSVKRVFVGDGPEEKSLRRKAEQEGLDVFFAGRKSGEDLYAWYNLADVLVLPSHQEAFGAVAGEALTAGCPVIVSSHAGSAFLVREGENGSVVSPTDLPGWKEALSRWAIGHECGKARHSLFPLSFEQCINDLINQLTCKSSQ